jgi:hypothetical protein
MWWKTFLYGVALDYILSLILAHFLADEGVNSFLYSLGVFVGIEVFQALAAFKASLWANIIFYTAGRKGVANGFLTAAHEWRLPRPELNEISPADYFFRVSDDKGVDPETRVVAACNAGWLSYPGQTGRILEAVRVSTAWEDALTRYRDETRREPPQ